jgi:hypothetical protein
MLQDFTSGILGMGFAVCALFFTKFWMRTRDSLFLAFATCFFLLALGQVLTTILGLPQEERTWLYFLRLAGFLIVIAAILGKNLKGGKPR